MNDIEKRLEGYRRLIAIARDLASTLDLDVLLNRIIRAQDPDPCRRCRRAGRG
ncbi:MAG TPA: hypothetical protein VII97_05025 [Anaerolineales bacterium]